LRQPTQYSGEVVCEAGIEGEPRVRTACDSSQRDTATTTLISIFLFIFFLSLLRLFFILFIYIKNHIIHCGNYWFEFYNY